MDFNLLIESLKSGKGQLIAAGMTATSERAEQIDFSITYTLNGLILLVPKGSDIKRPTTLRERISLCRRARPLTSTHRKSLALNRWRLKMPMNALRL